MIKDGETIFIGGLIKENIGKRVNKFPILGDLLGDIPYLGRLFRKTSHTKVYTELVMFVTPHIIIHPELTEEEKYRYQMLDNAREDFLKEQEKERKKREGRKKQVWLIDEFRKKEPAPLEESTELLDRPVLSAAKEGKIEQEQQLPEDRGYIYVW